MKKIISIALCILMMTVAFTGYGADTAITAVDENETQVTEIPVNPSHQEAIEFLMDMGILSGTELKANEPAVRSVLAEVAVMATGGDNQPAMDTPFSDVKADDPSSGYIYTALQGGLMNGYSDGIFEPNGTVSSEQLTVVLARMTGYGAIAEIEGGTTAAYIKVASKAGLLKGISFKNPAVVSYGELAYAVRKALDVEIMEMSGVTAGETIYDRNTGKTLLNTALNMEEVKGQITSNYFTGLAAHSNLERNQVEISGKVYTTTKKNIADYLGWQVTAYVDSEDVVRAVEKVGFEDSEIILTSNEIESITNGTINYRDEKGRMCSVNYRTSGYLIYNGEAKLAWGIADLKGVINGEIRLLDADNNNVYEVIFADNYTDLVVNSVSITDETVYFKSGSLPAYIDLSEDNEIRYELKDSDGNIIEITDIAKNNLLSLAMSKTENVCKMVVSKELVVGKCTAIAEDSITIDETEYRLSETLKLAETVKLNSEGTFYINYMGNVTVFDSDIVYNYAYLKDIDDKGRSSNMEFELFTADGTLAKFRLADKVKFNDSSRIKSSSLKGNPILFNGDEVNCQLITYKLNSEGEINRFSTAVDGSSMSYAEKENVFSLDAVFDGGATDTSTRYIGNNWKMFAGRYRLDDDTKVFLIPSDTDKDDKYKVVTHTGLVNETFYGNIQLFDEDESNVVKAIVIPADGVTNIDQHSPIAVVKKIKKVLNDDGDYDDSIVVVSGGKDLTLTAESGEAIARMAETITDREKDDAYSVVDSVVQKIELSKLDVGDVICYNAGTDGSLNDVEVIMRANYPVMKEYWPGTSSLPSANYFYMARYAVFSTVETVIEGGVRVTVPAPTGTEIYTRVFPFSTATSVLRLDEEGEISAIAAGDIAPEDKIFIYSGSSGISLAVVYRR